MLIELMKLNNISIIELAQELKISPAQIYKWDKEGILETNPHYKKVKRRFPSITPRSPTLTKQGLEDKRTKGRPRKELTLKETTIAQYEEKKFKSEVFPKVIYKSPK